jgi:tmRNA-binding protein
MNIYFTQKEVIFMENCVKTILYTYPKLKTLEEDYGQHIENKAVLSHRYHGDPCELVEYIAGEILKKRKLEWLKKELDCLLDKFSEEEYLLLSIRYFGKISRAKNEGKKLDGTKEFLEKYHWSERSYYRKQGRVLKKMVAEINRIGITKEVFEKEYLQFEFFKMVYRFLKAKKKKMDTPRERAIVSMLN